MIKQENLTRNINARKPACKATAFSRAQEYRQLADERINLYLTRFASSGEVDEQIYEAAVDDYRAAVKEFERDIRIKETHYPCGCVFSEKGPEKDPRYLKTEALLAHGNAIKESFVPSLRTKTGPFVSCKDEAAEVYNTAFQYAQTINYGPYRQFTLLEQMNLEARAMSWRREKKPRRIVVFHTTLSPLSQLFLKSVYHYALRSGVEVWEYSDGRIPRSAIDLSFLKDRILDCCGIVFLASAEYEPGRDNIEFEIKAAEIFREAGDPAKEFLLDLGAKDDVKRRISSDPQKEAQFDTRLPEFLDSLTDIYECRKNRLENDDLWMKLEAAGLKSNAF